MMIHHLKKLFKKKL